VSVHPAVRLLEQLGSTPDEIALALHQRGVQGRPDYSSTCVLAVYLGGHGYKACVDTLVIDILGDDGWPVEDFAPSAAQAEFIQRFDDGFYPALVRPSEEAAGGAA
jgi:hypothetical protein